MRYANIHKGVFLARPNRFIAHVMLDGEVAVCHVKNTGRCKELLVPGATVYVTASDNPARKTKFDLVAVEKALLPQNVSRETNVLLINMDAQAPNKVFGEWAAAGRFVDGLTLLRPETVFGNSRFDFYWEVAALPPKQPSAAPIPALRRGFVEVKGVTLEEDGAAYFPDAPTERGVKHVEELIACKAAGYEAALVFVVQMAGVRSVSPNDRTHPAFGVALRRAAAAGVSLLAWNCAVTADSLSLECPIEVSFKRKD